MIIGIVLFGIATGFATMVTTFVAGLGLGAVLLAYPLGGIAGVALASIIVTIGGCLPMTPVASLRAAI